MGAIEAVLIAGPTGAGKSALALRIARRWRGVIVNADSMQVYRDLRVLTARPNPAEEQEAEHVLYGHVDGGENHSVGRWLADAEAALAAIWETGRLPIVVGGSGLYLQALREGLSSLPPVPDGVRERVRAEAVDRPTSDLHAMLASRDPASAATVRPSDRLRVLRALEIHAATGASLATLRRERVPGPLAGRRVAAVFLAPDRAELRGRLDRRFERMLDEGALDEIAALAARRLDPAMPVMRAHGVPALLRHLAGEIGIAEATARGQADTRAYVKRQFTWFRHQMEGVPAVAPDVAEDALEAQLAERSAV